MMISPEAYIDNIKDKSYKNLLKFMYLILILTISFTSGCCNTEYNDLYHLKYQNDWLYINEKGNVVFKISANKFDDVGNFYENRGFVTKKIRNIADDGNGADIDYKLVYLSIIDSSGNVIKTFDTPVFVIDEDFETNAIYIPEYYKGFARISFVQNKNIDKVSKYSQLKIKDVYVDINGNIVSKSQIPASTLEILNSYEIARQRFKFDEDLIPKRMPCDNSKDKYGCFAYIDKDSNIKLRPIYDAGFTGCGDWFQRNPYFYNDRAVIHIITKVDYPFIEGYYTYIDKQGKFINNERYEYAEPFYQKLTWVIKNGERYCINTAGEVVWSDKIQAERNKRM